MESGGLDMRAAIAVVAAITFTVLVTAPVGAADDSRVKAATREVETGAKKIGNGNVGEGVDRLAKGIGRTVEEGAKYTGEKLKEAGKAAEPEAKSTGRSIRDGAVSFGHSVKNFFTRLFGGT
jgi:hypothetical protein